MAWMTDTHCCRNHGWLECEGHGNNPVMVVMAYGMASLRKALHAILFLVQNVAYV